MKRSWEPLCAYMIAFLCMAAAFGVVGIYPFGPYSLLKMDLLHGYAPDFLEIRRALSEGSGALYSWSGMLGRNLLNCVMTEAASPFNLLMALFPERDLVDSLSLLTLVKIPLAAASFCLYIRQKGWCGGIGAVCFSVPYALCSYMTAFHFNIMWLDTVIALPLVFFGIDRLLDKDDARIYQMALAYAIFTCYVTAFQLCIFSGLYFLCGCVLRKKYRAYLFLRFVTASLLAAGICAVTLFVFMDSFGSSQYFHEKMPRPALNFSPVRFFAAHFSGGFPSVRFYSDSVPNICTGVFALVLMPLFLCSRRIPFREKLVWCVFASAVAFCFLLNVADYVVHGLHIPVMFPHRYSYIYSFALLSAAAHAYGSIKGISWKTAVLLALTLCILAGILFLLVPQHDAASVALYTELLPGGENEIGPLTPGRISAVALMLNVALICAYSVLLWASGTVEKVPVRRILAVLLLVLVCAESVIGGAYGIGYLRETGRTWLNQDLYDDMRVITASLNEESEFYRAEFHRNRSQSDSRIYGYNGFSALSGTSGGYSDGLEALLRCLGMSSSFNNLVWQDPTPVVSSLFAQKYLLDAGTLINRSATAFCYKESVGSIDVYENPYALPVGFTIPLCVGAWMPDGADNPFQEQNRLFSELSGQLDVFNCVEPGLLQTENLELSYGEEPGEYIYEMPDYLSYEDIVSGILLRAVIRYTSDGSGFMSFCIRGTCVSQAVTRVNGETVSSLSAPWGNASLNAGFIEAGDVVEIMLDLGAVPDGGERELERQGVLNVYAARLDMDSYAQGVMQLGKRGFCVANYDRTYIEGTVSCDEECLLWTSIPYDHNWHIAVDGNTVQPDCWGGALLSIKLPPGDHRIEFEYRMDHLPVAAGVSITAFVLTFMFQRKKVRKQV